MSRNHILEIERRDYMDIFEKIRSMDKKELSAAIKKAKEFVKTDEGRELVNKIKNGEAGIDKSTQEKLAKEIGNNPDIAKTLSDLLKG